MSSVLCFEVCDYWLDIYPFQCFLDITFCNVMFRLRFHGRRISLSLLKCFVFKFVG